MSDEFDVNAFLDGIKRNKFSDASVKDVLTDEMNEVASELGPVMWAVLHDFISKKPTSAVHFAAVVNSAMSSLVLWTVASLPPEHHDGAKRVMLDNFDAAAKKRDVILEGVGRGTVEGRAKLLEMINPDVLSALRQSAQIMRMNIEALKNRGSTP